MRRSLASIVIISLFAFVATDAMAKRRRKPKKQKVSAPVSVKIANQCKRAVGIRIGQNKFKIAAGKNSTATVLKPNRNSAYEYVFAGSKRDPSYVFLEGGGKYQINIHTCKKTWANITTRSLGPRPSGLSPNAAANIRFRSSSAKGKRLPNLEYRPGKRGRFKRLSVGFTRYLKAPGGKFNYGLKLKAGRAGPVLQMLNGAMTVEPGKNYLIEAGVVNGEIVLKFEDEGYPRKKK